jgi:hypothetical protein
VGERDGLIVGRELESAQLATFLTGPEGQALVLRGEAGVGKSALLTELIGTATAQDYRVVRAVGVEAESGLPFSGLHQLLYPLLPRAGEMGPDQRAVLDAVLGRAAVAAPSVMVLGIAVLDLLTMASLEEPLLLAVDDGQWFDAPSAEVLSFVGRRLGGLATKVVIVLRSDVESPFDGAGLPELVVGALPIDAAAALVDSRYPALAADVRQAVLDHADGNPLALLELPASLAALGRRGCANCWRRGMFRCRGAWSISTATVWRDSPPLSEPSCCGVRWTASSPGRLAAGSLRCGTGCAESIARWDWGC